MSAVGYSLGSLVTGSFGTVPGLLLLPYLTNTMGVAAGVAALLVLLPKAWDVVLNPIVGRISDRTQTRWGARRPYLLFAGIAVTVLFISIFAAPVGVDDGAGYFVAAMFLLTATAFAFFQVPYVAMPAEMTDSYSERTRLMTWRVALLATSILVAGAGAPYILDAMGGGIPGHRWMALFVGAIMLAGTLIVFYSTAKAPIGQVTASEPSLRAQLKVAAANQPFRVLVVCFVAQSTGVACMLAGVRYFAVYVMDDLGATTLLFLTVVSPALFTMPIWRRVGERFGKLRGYVVASITLTAATLALTAAPLLPDVGVYAIIAIIGFGYAGPAAVRAVHAARLHRLRHPPHRQTPGRGVHRRVDGGGDARARARAGHLRLRSGAVRVRLHHHGRVPAADRARRKRGAAGIHAGPCLHRRHRAGPAAGLRSRRGPIGHGVS